MNLQIDMKHINLMKKGNRSRESTQFAVVDSIEHLTCLVTKVLKGGDNTIRLPLLVLCMNILLKKIPY